MSFNKKEWDEFTEAVEQVNKDVYKVENPAIKWQIEYTESFTNRKLTNWEKQLFEWAYIQGKEDYKEGKTE